jgi:hypothetical protein
MVDLRTSVDRYSGFFRFALERTPLLVVVGVFGLPYLLSLCGLAGLLVVQVVLRVAGA